MPKEHRTPAFQFYPNDWLGSTHIMLMSPAEEGAYIRLLAIAWNSPDCGLPDDDAQLAILSRLNEGWFNGSSSKVRQCFFSKNNRLFNKRLISERKKQEEWREKCRVGGIASGKSRRSQEKAGEGLLKGSSTKDELKGNSSVFSLQSSSSKKEKNIYSPAFDEFWKAYPKKRSKGDAEKAWIKISPSPEIREKIFQTIEIMKKTDDWKKDGGKFIPYPASWLNSKGWDDEPLPQKRNIQYGG